MLYKSHKISLDNPEYSPRVVWSKRADDCTNVSFHRL